MEASPKLFFLFMTYDSLPNEELWADFFATANSEFVEQTKKSSPGKGNLNTWGNSFVYAEKSKSYKAFVHCEAEEGCRTNITHQNIFKIIPTVPSSWCYNLVGPMDALLDAALAHGGHPLDKFVFVSGNTVPVKSFSVVRRKLIEQGGNKSNFCISAQGWWAWHEQNAIAIKHQQWVVLSRAHAKTIVSRRNDERDQLQYLSPLHWLGTKHVAPKIHSTLAKMHLYSVPFAYGCLDEYLYFALLFGYVPEKEFNSGSLDLQISGSPLVTKGSISNDMQGQCDTFATFGVEGGNFTGLLKIFHEDPDTKISKVGRGWFGPLHPVHFETLSEHALLSFRNSSFLFARKIDKTTKFVGNISLRQAFRRLVYAE